MRAAISSSIHEAARRACMSVMSCMEPDEQPTAAQMAAMAPALSSAVAAMNGLNSSRTGCRSATGSTLSASTA